MKKLIYLLILLAACKGPDKKAGPALKVPAKTTAAADTAFIVKEKGKDFYHAVYIEKDRNARVYKALLDFKYDHNDSVAYKANYRVLKIRNRKPLKKYDLEGLPNDWLPLNLYKGKYYLYAPCNWGNAGIRHLTDSTLNYYNADGPDPKPILDFKKQTDRKYNLVSMPFYQFVRSSNITIYVIDPKNWITVWEDRSLPLDYRYRLFVAKEHAASYDMIVNNCKTERTLEFDFEKVNFKKLIKGL
ncbi:hypothetical protein [Mucilaginibacter phyllosphaerae]|uniref:Uncharacterized protein n=1 Tax=Mucilaginibacter phyllosphaerae TaxID=1812349 RepID=A0A4Y8AFL3_9SPHI|nr:hypothetical protein [Mucilaginibacter phyllosphaerae]MBB3968798.1 hypothetical protein [Mucilaginibacter phyllosphaerae]TEW67567.1 hypothetical protein E2R65_06150 [Mucilaginibacter phyllosphaerae]GGH13813.1 hypothetical protein GCM10007352_21530 [Mucilaginibacter phyllosphaerae]